MRDGSDGNVRHASALELRELQYKTADEMISHKFKSIAVGQGISKTDNILAAYQIDVRVDVEHNHVSGNHVNVIFSNQLAVETLEKWASVPEEMSLPIRLVLDTGNATFNLSVERSRKPCNEFLAWAKEFYRQQAIEWPSDAPEHGE